MNNSVSSDKCITVNDFIAFGYSDDITYYKYSLLKYLNGFEMFVTNLLYDYEEEFNERAITVQLNQSEKYKYRYQPGLLAYDVYGSTELAFIVMMLNGIIDPKEFDFDQIKLLRTDELSNLLNRILIINSEYMNYNRSQLQEDLTDNPGIDIW